MSEDPSFPVRNGMVCRYALHMNAFEAGLLAGMVLRYIKENPEDEKQFTGIMSELNRIHEETLKL